MNNETESETKIESESDILTLTEVSEILQVHPNTLRNWDKTGELKALRIGDKGRRRYRRLDVNNYIKKMENAKPEDYKKPKSQ